MSCAVCERPRYKRQRWCARHYQRWLKYGDPHGGGTLRGEPRAFLDLAVARETDDCIDWPFALSDDGYGLINLGDGGSTKAHHRACVHAHGPAPDGHETAHSCRNRACINPRHLRWATHADNIADMDAAGTRAHGAQLSKLTTTDVEFIRSSGLSQTALAVMFEISRPGVNKILRGHRWAT